jgi:hypothetical protein
MFFQLPHPPSPPSRRGAVLLVVITMLVLFAAVALAFVYYAQSESTGARYHREGETAFRADMDPELALDYLLGKLIYGDPHDVRGVYSAMRGHDLARLVFEAFPTAGLDNSSPITAFNGQGRQHIPNVTYGSLTFPDDYNLVNYTYYQSDGFLRDPGRPGSRANLNATPAALKGGLNVPWTYPDANNMFLAVVNKNGEILAQSFHRPWLFNWIGGKYYPLNDTADNPNWINPQGKYYVLFPRPQENPGFPLPDDGGGHVKNVDGWGFKGVPVLDPNTGLKTGQYYNNDSVWMDIGAPVLTAPDGTKYKALFAVTIIDLDHMVNLNVTGNVRGTTNANSGPPPYVHVSNQGWGPWEINVSRILPNTALQLFSGNGAIPGRYGKFPYPGGGSKNAPTGSEWPPRFLALVDFDGAKTLGAAPNWFYNRSEKYYLPGEAPNNGYVCYADFYSGAFPQAGPSTTYSNNDASEELNHPLLYNFFYPYGGDLVFGPRNMEALLRYGSTGAPAFNSKLFDLLAADLTANPQTRLLLTTHSFDYVRPGAWPWLPGSAVGAPYTLANNALYPTGAAWPSSQVTTGEFGADSRALTAVLGRLNLNNLLRNYPMPDATGYIDLTNAANSTAFQNAQADRQQLALDIFNRLRWVTTGDPPNTPLPALGPQRDALRWLAQLAVNIVDYRDCDDFMTPFNWTGNPADADGWVFGTEPSRAVLNEAYSEVDNDPADPFTGGLATLPYHVNFWVELHDPLMVDPNAALPATLQNNWARLKVVPNAAPAYAAYQLLITPDTINATMRLPANTLGDPNYGGANNPPPLVTVNDYTPEPAPAPQPLGGVDFTKVQAANGGWRSQVGGNPGGNSGFYVLGPKDDFPGAAASQAMPTLRDRGTMMYPLPVATVNTPASHAVVLRRLACPALPPQTNPALPNYNPYVTVDYVQGVTTWDARTNVLTGANANLVAVAKRYSLGRKEPYAADRNNFVAQNNNANGLNPAQPVGQPANTFFYANASNAWSNNAPPTPDAMLTQPFHWLVHLDRQTISPMELLHVSGFAPHLLTQQFMAGSPIYPLPFGYSHRAPWFDQTARIYRFFEYLENASRAAGVGGRVPGKININTFFDQDIFQAQCDAEPPNNGAPQSSGFTENDVLNAYANLIKSRTPAANGMPGPNDVPFQSMAMGNCPIGDPQFPASQLPGGSGINNTFLRALNPLPTDPTGGAANARILQSISNANNPYRQMELMNKIYNTTTTRSHVFAMWATVGFFQVTDDTKRPVVLGPEIGKAEGRNVRHRMFAIIDRSQLVMPQAASLGAAVTAGGSVPVPVTGGTGTQTTPVAAITGTGSLVAPRTGTYPWTIQEGSTLVVDTGAAQEVVVVTAVNVTATPPTITATFNVNHAQGAAITFPGNQGPVQRYDPRQDSAVVPYFTIIE